MTVKAFRQVSFAFDFRGLRLGSWLVMVQLIALGASLSSLSSVILDLLISSATVYP